MLTIFLLFCSNTFMTIAWYGHLRFRDRPLLLVIVVSWLIAFAEYCFQVSGEPHRLRRIFRLSAQNHPGDHYLIVFAVFAYFYLKESPRWNYLMSFALLGGRSHIRVLGPAVAQLIPPHVPCRCMRQEAG
jgi:uncharacterized protein (DUF486 family)